MMALTSKKSVSRSSLDLIPTSTLPDTVVDVNKLTPLEQKIFNMTKEEWNKIEDDILS